MTDVNVMQLIVSGVIALLGYSMQLNLKGLERRFNLLEKKSESHSGEISGITVNLAAYSARQDELGRRLEEVSRALFENTRAMQSLSEKLVEVSIRGPL